MLNKILQQNPMPQSHQKEREAFMNIWRKEIAGGQNTPYWPDTDKLCDYWLSRLDTLLSEQEREMRESIAKEVENRSVPALANSEEVECCNCGEDLALESYDWFTEGYEMANKDAASIIRKTTE